MEVFLGFGTREEHGFSDLQVKVGRCLFTDGVWLLLQLDDTWPVSPHSRAKEDKGESRGRHIYHAILLKFSQKFLPETVV